MALLITGKSADRYVSACLHTVHGGYGLYQPDGYPLLKGYYWSDLEGCYVAFDNTTGECWVEDYHTREQALEWLAMKPDSLMNINSI